MGKEVGDANEGTGNRRDQEGSSRKRTSRECRNEVGGEGRGDQCSIYTEQKADGVNGWIIRACWEGRKGGGVGGRVWGSGGIASE